MGTALERASQPLSFRLLRLRSPTLHTSSHPAFDLATDITTEGHNKDDNEHRFAGSTAATQEDLSSKHCRFEDRVLLRELPQQLGLTGTLLLPQEFGRVYIGQQLCLAIVMQNASRTVPVHCVGVTVEMLNDRSRAVLYDTSGEDVDLPTIGAGEHHEILIQRDMKDLGKTTLMVKAWFLLPGSSDKLYQGGSFVFEVSNPLTVRTKVRKIEPSHQIFLEATLINQTEETMILEKVDLVPSKNFRCEAIPPPLPRAVSDLGSGPVLDACFNKPWLPPQGGAFSFLYCLATAIQPTVSGAPPSATSPSGGGIGKLDIRWRGPMGAYARLQTQSIVGYEDVRCAGDELMLRVVNIKPDRRLKLYEACTVEISVRNHSRDQSFGPAVLSMSDPTPPSGAISTFGDEINEHIPRRGVVLNGEQEIEIQKVLPGEAVVATMSFLPLHKGRHYLQGIVLTDAKDGRVYDRLPAIEVFVH